MVVFNLGKLIIRVAKSTVAVELSARAEMLAELEAAALRIAAAREVESDVTDEIAPYLSSLLLEVARHLQAEAVEFKDANVSPTQLN